MRTAILFTILFLSAGCSIIADADAFTYIEGSASDNDSAGDTEEPVATDSFRDSDTPSDSEMDTGTELPSTDSENDTASTDPPAAVCTGNDDCPDGSVCPILFTNDLFREAESYCYVDCSKDAAACDGTQNPLCYQHESGAVCLNRTRVTGTFACRLLTSTVGNQVELTVRPGDTPIRLERCEMYSDDVGFGFIFSTVLGEGVIEAGFYVPDIRIGNLQTGLLENASGEIFRKVLDADMTPTESTMLGFFPPPGIDQDPRLTREIDIQEITSAGPIRGNINFDGFSYDAEMNL